MEPRVPNKGDRFVTHATRTARSIDGTLVTVSCVFRVTSVIRHRQSGRISIYYVPDWDPPGRVRSVEASPEELAREVVHWIPARR